MVAFLVILFLLLASGAPTTAAVCPAGTARVVNRDTLAVAGNRVRLKGVAAPEPGPPARRGEPSWSGWSRGRTWCTTSPASARGHRVGWCHRDGRGGEGADQGRAGAGLPATPRAGTQRRARGVAPPAVPVLLPAAVGAVAGLLCRKLWSSWRNLAATLRRRHHASSPSGVVVLVRLGFQVHEVGAEAASSSNSESSTATTSTVRPWQSRPSTSPVGIIRSSTLRMISRWWMSGTTRPQVPTVAAIASARLWPGACRAKVKGG